MRKTLTLRIFVGALVLFALQKSFATANGFCQKKFGSAAMTSFEPIESNGGGVVDNFITGKQAATRSLKNIKPTGFVCLKEIVDASKVECPAGLKFNNKRSEFPICISKVFPLNEMCPDEIKQAWPELSTKICKAKKYKLA